MAVNASRVAVKLQIPYHVLLLKNVLVVAYGPKIERYWRQLYVCYDTLLRLEYV
jgi:hypothetical protein